MCLYLAFVRDPFRTKGWISDDTSSFCRVAVRFRFPWLSDCFVLLSVWVRFHRIRCEMRQVRVLTKPNRSRDEFIFALSGRFQHVDGFSAR